MSKINELIKELCPNGVIYKKYGDVFEIKTGKGITTKEATDDGLYPIISGGTTPMGYYHSYNRDENIVTVSRVGANAGYVNFITEKFYLNDKCFSIIPKDEFVKCFIPKYIYHYTKNIKKYTFRLFLFAFISHFAYIFASNDFVDVKSFIPFYYGNFLNQTSVMWSLAWGLVMLRVAYSNKLNNVLKVLFVILICIITLPSDWSCIAALCIMAIGTNRGNFKNQMLWMIFYVFLYSLVYFFAIDKLYGIIQMAVVISIPVIYLYNGQRGKNEKVNKFMKWFFYIYYPLHLAIIGVINLV